MSANSGSGGVRNLRAMFENKASDQSTSPPSRGRSPNPSELSNNSRPVSKVRSSFVAVERPGENGSAPIVGLMRRPSQLSSHSENKENHTMDSSQPEKPPSMTQVPEKTDAAAETEKSPPDAAPVEGGLGNILKGSAFVESTPRKDTSDARNLGVALSSGALHDKSTPAPSNSKDDTKAAEMVQKIDASKESKPGPPPTTVLQTTKTAQPIKPPPTRQAITKQAPKSPVASKPSPKNPTSPMAHIRGGPAKIRGVMDSAKEAQKGRDAVKQDGPRSAEKPPSHAAKPESRPKPKPAPVNTQKQPNPASPKAARTSVGVKPRSPNVPNKLPAAATAPTAASAARTEAHRSPTDPHPRQSIAKRPSATSVRPPRASTSSTTTTLAKKTSHASLTNGHDRPKSRVSTSKPDEGFLARMMRPTASSAQKVHEKVQINSPPRPKVAPSHKSKEAVKHKAPPKMHLQPTCHHEQENKENEGANDQESLPEVAAMSPLTMAKEEATHIDTEKGHPQVEKEHSQAEKEHPQEIPTESTVEQNGEPVAV
ncbi:hypothetical protein KCU88_g2406, partial [Aureobasidium melanogenum]